MSSPDFNDLDPEFVAQSRNNLENHIWVNKDGTTVHLSALTPQRTNELFYLLLEGQIKIPFVEKWMDLLRKHLEQAFGLVR